MFTFLNIAVSKYGAEWVNIGAWQTAVRYFPAFICGMLTVKLEIVERMLRWSMPLRMLTFAVSALLVLFICYMPSLPLGMLYVNIPIYCFLISLYVLLSVRPIRFGQRVLTNLDKHSMGIYIVHHLLIWCALIYIPGITMLMDSHYIIAPAFLFLITFSLSWLLTTILSKNSFSKLLFDTRIAANAKPATS